MATADEGTTAEVGLCLLLAIADGDVSERETARLTTRLGAVLGDAFPMGALVGIIDAELEAMHTLGPDGYIARIAARIPEARRTSALRAALGVACGDGLAPEEAQMFRDVAAALGLTTDAAEAMLLAARAPSRR